MSEAGKKSLEEIHRSVNISDKKTFWKKIMAFLGPAYLVSAGYMDPGNWATDIAGGSQFGYLLLWVLLMSNIMALLLQSLCTRLGIVSGFDLAQASRKEYPRSVNFVLFILAEIAIAACNLAEVVGMAIGLELLFGIPLTWGVSITVLDSFLLPTGKVLLRACILERKKQPILLVHIVETPGALMYGNQIKDFETSSDASFLESYHEELEKNGYKVELELGFGVPKKAIPRIVNSGNFDLLVLGSHGHAFFKDLLFGTTVDGVRHKIKVPVFIS